MFDCISWSMLSPLVFFLHIVFLSFTVVGQAGAIRLGIARALQNFDPWHRPALKRGTLVTNWTSSSSVVFCRLTVGVRVGSLFFLTPLLPPLWFPFSPML